MDIDDAPFLPVRCPQCLATNQVCITYPVHQSLRCGGCNHSFVVDRTLIALFYASDDAAITCLEDLYRAPLVLYFRNRGLGQVQAEECQIDVFTRVWETKYPSEGNAPQRYDPDHSGAASFRTWLFRIAWHILLDRRRPQLLFSDLQEDESDGEEPVDPTALQRSLYQNNNRRPADEAIAREHQEAVHDCRDKLPPREKLAIHVWRSFQVEALPSLLHRTC